MNDTKISLFTVISLTLLQNILGKAVDGAHHIKAWQN